MANGPALSTAKGGEIYLGSEIDNSLSLLDVLYANQFERVSLGAKLSEQTEENFYRGAPPEWLNFHISEQAESDGLGTPFIKRDGYDTLVQQIRQRRKLPGISTVKLFHQSGCGGTTLAMQHFVDRHRTVLINGVRDTRAILDKLMDEGLISNETYNAVRASTTQQDQMREILRFVSSAGTRSKDAFYQIINEKCDFMTLGKLSS
uniref:CARD domain-containing protein n=1 Tax=Seriola dumerili TaxID=41447 RepID=A0A3B4URZ5_SERDU